MQGWYFKDGSPHTGVQGSQPPTYPISAAVAKYCLQLPVPIVPFHMNPRLSLSSCPLIHPLYPP